VPLLASSSPSTAMRFWMRSLQPSLDVDGRRLHRRIERIIHRMYA
jgi:hypothetical protein